jgi:hypothetical protein
MKIINKGILAKQNHMIKYFIIIDEMTEFSSGISALQFEHELSLRAKIRDGSRSNRLLCLIFVDVKFFHISIKRLFLQQWVHVHQVEEYN